MAGKCQKTISINRKVYAVAEESAKAKEKSVSGYVTELILHCREVPT